MKKFAKIIGGILCSLVVFGCSDLAELNSDSGDENFGTIVFGSGERYIDKNEIISADVTVYVSKTAKYSAKDVNISGGSGNYTIENIPVGKNRIIEVTGYKDSAKSVPVKYLYKAVEIKSGNNTIALIKDGADSAKGKAYLALLNAGVDVSSVTLSGFDSVSSAYLFDADGFAAAYKTNSSASVSSYIQTAGSVTFSNISGASGYSIWIDDPLSGKVSVSSDSQTSASASNVAPGTWNVYVNDGSATKKAGSVNVTSGGTATYSDFIGNVLAGKTVIFVKCAANTNLYAWTETSKTELCGAWSGTTLTTKATSAYMNDPSGWYMVNVSGKYGNSTEKIKIILIPQGGNKSDDLDSKIAGTFWYDYTSDTFYDSDPTAAPVLDSDATLSDIKVNGSSVGVVTSCEVSNKTESATVTATANSSKATVAVSPSSATTLTAGSAKDFTITVTAEDGTVKTYKISVARKAETENDVTLSSINVNGSSIGTISGTSFTKSLTGSGDSLSVTVTAEATASSATVTVTAPQTVSDGGSKTFTITVKNGSASATYTVTVSYTKAEVVASEYYWTNKKGAVGTNKTISSWSDWTDAERIAQNAAYDDPRTWKGHQEVPYDVYALYAAYDDTNLYLMVELTNIADRASFMCHDYAGSDNAWWNNRDIPLGMLFNTGKGANATKPTVVSKNEPIWGSIDFSDAQGFDALFYHSSKYGEFDGTFVEVGTPGLFKTTSEGVFSYDADYCFSFNTGTKTGTSGISVKYQRQCAVSKTIYYESTPTDNRTTSGQDGNDLLASTTYTSVSTGDLDMSYWYTIPLSTLGIDKAYLQSTGIGVRQLTTNGGSLMDCSPWDISMVDVASEGCPDDVSTSAEKKDCDDMTSDQARIGHM